MLQKFRGADFMGEEGQSRPKESVTGNSQNGWARVMGRLKQEIGETAYRSWFRSMTVERVIDGEGVIAVPTRFMRNWVTTHYSDRLLALWHAENKTVNRISFVVAPHGAKHENGHRREERAAAEPAATVSVPAPTVEPTMTSEPTSESTDDRGHVSAPLDPRSTFDNFVVGKPNELAHAAARRVAEACCGATTHSAPFNPLFLYGGVGLGKTHLMHAIAWQVRKSAPGRKVIYLSAETFMHQFIKAIRFKSQIDFKEEFRSVDLLMIDDVQFIAGKETTQEEFFHTFNALVDQGRQIVISADKSPSDIEGLEERLRSRLGWGLVADIHPTTYELRLGILESKAEQMGLRLPQKIMEFLAHKITSNVRELEGALNRLGAHAQLVRRELTLESAHEVLQDLLRASDRRVTIDEIQRKVAEHFNIKFAEMTSSRRARVVARPRQVAMYLAKQLTQRSLPEIGRKFGGRDHTTVMHAVRQIEKLAQIDRALAEDVDVLQRMLGH
jgi:chromosomal replication initiator protein